MHGLVLTNLLPHLNCLVQGGSSASHKSKARASGKGKGRAGGKERAGDTLAGSMDDMLRESVEVGLGDEDSTEGRAEGADKGRGKHQGSAERTRALSEDGELQVCSCTSVCHLIVD